MTDNAQVDVARIAAGPEAVAAKPRQMHLRWTTESGLVLLEFPSNLSPDDVDDVKALLSLTLSGMERRAHLATQVQA